MHVLYPLIRRIQFDTYIIHYTAPMLLLISINTLRSTCDPDRNHTYDRTEQRETCFLLISAKALIARQLFHTDTANTAGRKPVSKYSTLSDKQLSAAWEPSLI